MKLFICRFLAGCFLLLLSGVVYSQDTSRKTLPQMPKDSTFPASQPVSHDTILPQNSPDTLLKDSALRIPPAASLDSVRIYPDSTRNIVKDSAHHTIRTFPSAASSSLFPSGRR